MTLSPIDVEESSSACLQRSQFPSNNEALESFQYVYTPKENGIYDLPVAYPRIA